MGIRFNREVRLGMKVRELYANYFMIAGLGCLLLGLGNWIIGAVETAKYQNLLLKTAQTGLEDSYRNFQQLDQQRNEEVLRRLTENREKYNAARVKLNFFYVVLTGGRLLFLIGSLIAVVTLFRLIRRDAQSKIQKLEF
jgi:Mg2+/citrate symporter